MSDEIPERLRAMTRRDVIQAVRDGVLQATKLDGSPFMFPTSDRKPRSPKAPRKHKITPEQSRSQRIGNPERARLYAEQNGHCFYCNKRKDFYDWTIDHKTPICRGGSKVMSNTVGACATCNSAKGPLTVDEFLAVRHDN